jgi:hypothetical protein
MAYKPTGGKAGRPKKGTDSHGNPVQPPEPGPTGMALSVAEAKRADAIRRLQNDIALIDSFNPIGASGQQLPAAISSAHAAAREAKLRELERISGLTGWLLVDEFASQFRRPAEPQPEPVRLEETLNRGGYLPRAVKGAAVVEANPGYMAQYRARMAEQEAQAERQRQIKAGQEALALAALAGQES